MNNWKITALYYGQSQSKRSANCPGLDPEMWIDLPFSGFLLQDGHENVLVDSGISDDAFNGLDLSGRKFYYGQKYVLESLAEAGVKPEDIDKVIYTHLHFDHCGNMDLFPDAITYIQKEEYYNLLNLYDFQTAFPPEYLPSTLEQVKKLKHLCLLDGDTRLGNGLELILVKGHSLGGQAVVVPTANGRYVLTGDTPPNKSCIFPEIDEMVLMDGTKIKVTPAPPDRQRKYLAGQGIWDLFSIYESYDKLMYLAEKPEPEYFLPSHCPENIFRKHFG